MSYNAEMKAYICDVENDKNGEWVILPMETDELDEVISKYSCDGESDIVCKDYVLPFAIDKSDDLYQINELCQVIYDLGVTKGLLDHINDNEMPIIYFDGFDLKKEIDHVYKLKVDSDSDFAKLYTEEYDFETFTKIEALPWAYSNSIDWEKVYTRLEETMQISKDDEFYYFSFQH